MQQQTAMAGRRLIRAADAVPPGRRPTGRHRCCASTIKNSWTWQDAQYDAAVSHLGGKRLKTGRGRLGRLDESAIVEHNLGRIIDQAISQAREALVGDPANSYLNSLLVEARRRKAFRPACERANGAYLTDTN
jgi:hypothetical protein